MRENCESWWKVWHRNSHRIFHDTLRGLDRSCHLWMTFACHSLHSAHKPTTNPYVHVNLHTFIFDSHSNQSPWEIIINYIMIHSSWFPASCIWSLFVPYLGTLWSLFPFSALFVVSHGFAPLRCNAFAFGHGWAGVGIRITFNDLSRPRPQKVAFWASDGIPSKWRCCSLGTIRVSHRL